MTPFETAKAQRDALEAACSAANKRLAAYPRNAIGLTPDDVKLSPTYRADKRASEEAFAALRAFNGWYVRTYAREIREERCKRLGCATRPQKTKPFLMRGSPPGDSRSIGRARARYP